MTTFTQFFSCNLTILHTRLIIALFSQLLMIYPSLVIGSQLHSEGWMNWSSPQTTLWISICLVSNLCHTRRKNQISKACCLHLSLNQWGNRVVLRLTAVRGLWLEAIAHLGTDHKAEHEEILQMDGGLGSILVIIEVQLITFHRWRSASTLVMAVLNIKSFSLKILIIAQLISSTKFCIVISRKCTKFSC